MQIRTKITLQFVFIVALILTLFTVAIYYFSADYREQEFYTRLKIKAETTAKLYSNDVPEITPQLLKLIDKNSVGGLSKGKVVIYDLSNRQLYKTIDSTFNISNELLYKIKREKEVRYHDGANEALGIVFNTKDEHFIVISSALDKYGLSKLKYLKNILISGFFITLVITFFLAAFYSEQALRSISGVVKQVENITAFNLNSRVDEGNGTDEVARLAIEFNKMLERLGASFEAQKNFVANASHELRTPLTSVTGQIEVFLMNKQINEEVGFLLKSVLEDIRNLNKLSNGLLNLAQTEMDASEIKYEELRIDEIVGQLRAEMLKRNTNYIIDVEFNEFPENEYQLATLANEQLIKIALLNIIENACKYSPDKRARVAISFTNNQIKIEISDKGMGISADEIEKIFEPFYRSKNKTHIAGHGIGLALAKKIILLHKGSISIESIPNSGTIVSIILTNRNSN